MEFDGTDVALKSSMPMALTKSSHRTHRRRLMLTHVVEEGNIPRARSANASGGVSMTTKVRRSAYLAEEPARLFRAWQSRGGRRGG